MQNEVLTKEIEKLRVNDERISIDLIKSEIKENCYTKEQEIADHKNEIHSDDDQEAENQLLDYLTEVDSRSTQQVNVRHQLLFTNRKILRMGLLKNS